MSSVTNNSSISLLPGEVLGSLQLPLLKLKPFSFHAGKGEKMSDYKLRYFNYRARGEPIRFIFKYAGIEFEDERIPQEDWLEIKPTLLFHQLPVLHFNGNEFFGSQQISRHLGRQFGLCGSTEADAVRCDEVVDVMQDLIPPLTKFFTEEAEEQKELLRVEMVETTIPKYFNIYEECIERAGGRFLVTDGVTWADLFVVAWLENFQFLDPSLLDNYPKLRSLYEEVRGTNAIKDWIESRPECVF